MADEITPEMIAQVTQQIELSYSILDEMKLLGSFKERDILSHIVVATGMPPMLARMYFQHIVTPMLNKTVLLDGDTYTYVETPKPTIADHMKSFKAMLDPPSASSLKGH